MPNEATKRFSKIGKSCKEKDKNLKNKCSYGRTNLNRE